jgi:prephenate dehydratase
MSTLKVAFQGERGANSDIAARKVYPDCEPVACATFEDALQAVQRGKADVGMIPIDNSIAGRVADIHHLLPHAGLHIIGEYFLPVHFNLMALKGATLQTVKSVESHIHALGQCRKFIGKHKYKTVTAADTAGAARHISESNDITRAALAPALAAKIYGLKLLARNVEDEEHNTTRFVIVSRDPKRVKPNNGLTVTTFIFQVRNLPAALYKALGGFATNSVNMTKLESYMIEGNFFATMFYADVEGHPDELPLKRALDELRFFSQPRSFKTLGVYPGNAKYRRKNKTAE